MKLDVQSLRTFSRLAHSGSQRAAGSLSQLTGLDTHVDVTKIELSSRTDVQQEFLDRDLVSVRIGFDGGIDGETVLAFPRGSAEQLVEKVMPGAAASDAALVESGMNELGNIMIGGFIDGWAEYLGTSIEISTPTYVDVDGGGALSDDGHDDESQVLVFRNQLEATAESVSFYLFMVPTASSVGAIVDAEGGGDAVPLDSFASFSQMIAEGAQEASANISMLTGIDTDVEVCRLNFVPIEGVPAQLEEESRTGVVLEFEGLPSGYIAILFDDDSAESVASSLLPGGGGGGEEMRQSAIQEIGNIVTSGFVDGWANALETKIEISTPTYVNDLGPAIVDPLVADLARDQEYAFLIDSTIRTDDDEFTCDIYALPDESELRTALNELAPSAV
jgi:chemotaxis protein CheC